MTTKNFKPILFSTEMVQALLAGKKTQTRRTHALSDYNKNPDLFGVGNVRLNGYFNFYRLKDEKGTWAEPKYQPGDILWVRETFAKPIITAFGVPYIHKAGFDRTFCGWKPSIHMPKEAARIFLKVTDVRVERLQDISEEDAIAEGCVPAHHYNTGKIIYQDYLFYTSDPQSEDGCVGTAQKSFETLWQSINAKKHPWKSNPWVWVYEFERIEKPENF